MEKRVLKLDFLKILNSKAAKDAGAEEVAPGTPGGAGGSSGTRYELETLRFKMGLLIYASSRIS